MAAGNEMRVSDAEREAAAAELREHFASGRLDQEELNERLDRVFAARTRGDLTGLFADLPSGGRDWDRAAAAGSGRTAGAGSFGPGSQSWGQGSPGSGGGSQWGPPGGGRTGGPGPFVGRLVFTGVLLWALLIIGILGAFGIGAPRPFGFVLIFAALALLRRLFFRIIGRRWGGGRGRRSCRRR